MAMDNRFAPEFRKTKCPILLCEKLAQQEHLFTESLRIFVVGQEVEHFVPKY